MGEFEPKGELIDPLRVAFALCTKYDRWRPDGMDLADTAKTRGDLALEFIQKATDVGYNVIIMDGGSSEFWLDILPDGAKLIRFKENNFGKQKAEAIKAASWISGVDVVIRTEAEKIDVLNHVNKLISPILFGGADMVVGYRKAPSFKISYPRYAYQAEIKTRRLLNDVIKLAGISSEKIDFYSGIDVFANKPEVLDLILNRYKYTGQIGVDTKFRGQLDGWFHAQVATIIEALMLGRKVKSVKIDFRYDARQRKNETHPDNIEAFKQKRRTQLRVAVQPAIQLVRHLLKDPKSQLIKEEN